MKIIELITDSGYKKPIEGISEHHNTDIWFGPVNDDVRISARLLTFPSNRQAVLDDLQSMLHSTPNTCFITFSQRHVL